MKGHKQKIWKTIGLAFLFLAIGCSVPPSEGTVEEVIVKYFEAKHYKVTALDLGDIMPVPISQQKYMGTKGYIVDIQSLKLDVLKNEGMPLKYKKGQHISFTNASVTIKKVDNQDKEWLITNITGISIP
jgi:hypothetical protein